MKKIPSILKALEKFLSKEKLVSPTAQAYFADIKQFLQFAKITSKNDLNKVNQKDISKFINSLKKQNLSPKTISRKINALKYLNKFLTKTGFLSKNFTKGLEHPSYSAKTPRILTKTESMALRGVTDGDLRSKAIVEILLQTGIKLLELTNLSLENIQLVKGPGYGKIEIGGGKNPRVLPLNNVLERVIKDYLRERPKTNSKALFVTSTGKPLLARNIRQKIKKLMLEAEIEKATVNDLRNSFIVQQLKNGVDILKVSDMAGFSNIASLNKYLKLAGKN